MVIDDEALYEVLKKRLRIWSKVMSGCLVFGSLLLSVIVIFIVDQLYNHFGEFEDQVDLNEIQKEQIEEVIENTNSSTIFLILILISIIYFHLINCNRLANLLLPYIL